MIMKTLRSHRMDEFRAVARAAVLATAVAVSTLMPALPAKAALRTENEGQCGQAVTLQVNGSVQCGAYAVKFESPGSTSTNNVGPQVTIPATLVVTKAGSAQSYDAYLGPGDRSIITNGGNGIRIAATAMTGNSVTVLVSRIEEAARCGQLQTIGLGSAIECGGFTINFSFPKGSIESGTNMAPRVDPKNVLDISGPNGNPAREAELSPGQSTQIFRNDGSSILVKLIRTEGSSATVKVTEIPPAVTGSAY